MAKSVLESDKYPPKQSRFGGGARITHRRTFKSHKVRIQELKYLEEKGKIRREMQGQKVVFSLK